MRYTELNEYIDASTIDVDKTIKEIKEESRREVSRMTDQEILESLRNREAKIDAMRNARRV